MSTSVYADDPPIGYIEVRDEGTALRRRRRINFVGAGVSVADDTVNAETDVTIDGGSGNSFETIAVPAGASVVADSSTDTLTLTDTGPVVITGTAATDTIDFDVTTSPASATTVVGTGRVLTSGAGLTGGGDLSADRTLAVGAGTGITVNSDDVALTIPVAVTSGGIGATTLTDGGILLGSGTGAITALGVASNGQLPIGDGTTDPVLATLTGTANEITVTNGAGTITLDIPTSPVFTTSAEISGAVPRVILTDTTASEDDFELVADGSTGYFSNTVDGVIAWILKGDNSLALGELGKEITALSVHTTTTGNAGFKLQDDSIGIQELDAVDEPANNEVYSYDSATGRGQWDAPGAGSADSWDTITAAAASSTTANGDNAIVYQTAQTTANRLSWRFTESTASTSTGTPVLLQADTIASSNAIPFRVRGQGTTGLYVSADASQVFATGTGSSTVPQYSFDLDADTGFNHIGGNAIGMIVGGVNGFRMDLVSGKALGTWTDDATVPSTFFTAGFFQSTTPSITNVCAGFQSVAASTLPCILAGRKARGTANNTPTVITTGDDLLQISGLGYVGDTNTFVEAANILMDSTGTISDASNGIAGDIIFNTRATSGSLTERIRINDDGGIRLPAVAAPGTLVEGDLWNDSTRKALNGFIDGINTKFSGTTFVATGSATVANTVTETTIVGTGIGTATLPANFLTVGKTVRVTARGFFSSQGLGETLDLKVKFGSTVIVSTGGQSAPIASNNGFYVHADITCRTTGATGTVFSQGDALLFSGTTTATNVEMRNTATVTVDTTASQAIGVTATWNTADAGNTITGTNVTFEVLD